MYLTKQEQYDNIFNETSKFWDRSSQLDSNSHPVNIFVAFTKTIESGELGNHLNDDLYDKLINAIKKINSGIDQRNQTQIMSNLKIIVDSIAHFPSIKALLGGGR